jgi:hypothetical protein
MIVFFKNGGLWIQDLDQVEPRRIPGMEGVRLFVPAWSPDSDYIACVIGNTLRKVSAHDGPSIFLCELPLGADAGGRTWGSERIIFSKGSDLKIDMRLYEVSDQGGPPELYMTPDSANGERSYFGPYFLPDRENLLFIVGKTDDTWDIVAQSGADRHVVLESLRKLPRFRVIIESGV